MDVVNDWQNREFIETVEVAVRKCVDFLNNFHESAKYRLSVVDARLSTLERKLDFLEASLENCDPSKRGAQPSAFKASMFDPAFRTKLIAQTEQKRRENRRIFNKIVVAPNKNNTNKPIINTKNAQPSSPKRKPQQQPKTNVVPKPQKIKQPEPAKVPKPQQKQAAPAQKPKSPQPQVPSIPPVPSAASPASSNQKPPPMVPPVGPVKNKPPPIPSAVPSGPGFAAPPPVPKQQPQPQPQPPQKEAQKAVPPQPPSVPVQNQPPPPVPAQEKPANKPPPPVPVQNKPPPKPKPQQNDAPGAVNKEWPNKAANQIDIFTISEGTGSVPSAVSAVEIEYTGHLPNGKQFIKHREVIQLGKKQNIKGLEQAITRIKVGSEIKLWVPSRFAYGARGAGNLIPPNSDLSFSLKLHRIVTQ